jgi:hypothetical protein
MSSTTAPAISLETRRPSAPPKSSPSRTPYRSSPETTFSAALRTAANEALAARYASPSPARIGAPVGASGAVADSPSPDAGLPGAETLPSAGLDARLWESLMRGTAFPTAPAGATSATPTASTNPAAPVDMTTLANRAEQLDPATLATMPSGLREAGQAFLASIKGSDQTAVSEYDSVAQARAWGYSTCSAASLTAVLRAAGQDVKIADVMQAMPGGMTIKLGLVSRPSLVNAANQFGAKATDDVTSYEALKQATDNGQPVLVDIRNGKFAEGHWIVVTGVDENGVKVADSSRYNLTSIPRGEFLRSWSSRGIRLEGLTPTAAPARANVQSA